MGDSRATQGGHAKPPAWRGERASLPAAPGIAPCPSMVDGRLGGEPAVAGGPSRQRSAHGPAECRGGIAPAPQADRRGKPCCVERSKTEAKPKPAARPATRGKRVSRAWSGARSAKRKAWGAPAFRDTGGVQTHELPAGRPDREKVMLALGHRVAVRSPRSPPAVAGNERGAGRYTGYRHHQETTYGEQQRWPDYSPGK